MDNPTTVDWSAAAANVGMFWLILLAIAVTTVWIVNVHRSRKVAESVPTQ